MFSYFDDWQSAILECPCCGWRGTFWEGSVEAFEQVFDSCCPECACQRSNRMLAVVGYATAEECELEANLAKLDPEEREHIEAWMDFRRRWEQASLKSPSQLPELKGGKLKLIWDFEEVGPDRYTVIRRDDVEVWRELALYGGGARFEEIANMLEARYGARLADLAPSSASLLYLYDDDHAAAEIVDRVRGRLRGASGDDGPLTSG